MAFTFYSVAFSSVSCAEFWDYDTTQDKERFEGVCDIAAANGNLEVLKWARKYGFPWFKQKSSMPANHGHLEVLNSAHDHGCPWDEWTCTYAAKNGHLEVLKYAHEEVCP